MGAADRAGGFTVTAFARKLDSPRWLYVLPNGDVLVAEARTLPNPSSQRACGSAWSLPGRSE